jgi:hypothetical protein
MSVISEESRHRSGICVSFETSSCCSVAASRLAQTGSIQVRLSSLSGLHCTNRQSAQICFTGGMTETSRSSNRTKQQVTICVMRCAKMLYILGSHKHWRLNVRGRPDDNSALAILLRDPLIRLVMNSDGVTENAMIAVMDQLSRSLAARKSQTSFLTSRQPAIAQQVTATVSAV